MKRALRVLLLLALPVALHAQILQEQHPNTARGFEPEKMYDFSAVDSVNMFNGNLTLRVPIGPKLAVNGALPYQLLLTYNSNCWDYIYWYDQATGDGGTKTMLQAAPTRRSNAGIGWSLSLGRILPYDTNEPRDGRVATYESSDGADHPLYPSLHGEAAGNYYYTRDGTYIRVTAGSSWLIELPDGTKQNLAYFDTTTSPWTPVSAYSSTTTLDRRLYQMTDVFGNTFTISYSSTLNEAEVWTITGAGATPIKAYFKTPAQLGLTTSYNKVSLDRVEVPNTRGGVATYQLHYSVRTTPPGAGDDFTADANYQKTSISVAVLDDVTLPTGEKYSFIYDTQWNPTTHTGTLTPAVPTSMTLPTGGTVQWTWDQALFDENSFQKARTAIAVPLPSAVQTRTYGGGQWQYAQTMGGTVCSTDRNGAPCPPNNPYCYGGSRQKTVAVTAPDNTTTLGYFSIYKRGTHDKLHSDFCATDPEGWDSAEYGLPLTRYCPSGVCTTAGAGGFTVFPSKDIRTGFPGFGTGSLSTWDGHGFAPGTRLRTTWTAYDVDAHTDSSLPLPPQNPRPKAAMTQYDNDPNCGGVCLTGSNSYGFDGFGHFRQESAFGNFGSSPVFRTSFTNYDGTLDQLGEWVLGTSTEQCTRDEPQQRTSAIGACSDLTAAPVTQTKYNRSTGALTARRTVCVNCSSPNGSRDLLAVFERDVADHGHISREKYYGGDVNPLPAGSDPFSTTAALEYEVDHTYSFSGGTMTMAAAKYNGTTFNVEDSDFDPAVGFITRSRDTAGVTADYEYDANNRLYTIKPAGQAWTEFVYTIASGSTPASIAVKQRPYNTSTTADALTDKRIVFDVWGRPIRQSHLGPNGWSGSETVYDGLGRVKSVSEPESTSTGTSTGSLVAAYKTTFDYDELGHQNKITTPDGSITTFTFTGERQKKRTASIWDGTAPDPAGTSIDTIETYDNLGRLAAVKEKSGPTDSTSRMGADVTTTYGYDSSNHLAFVAMSGSGAVQNRFFDYDSRGLLRWESQPESGMADYTYDSRGHVSTKSQSDANSPFDLKYTYDAAERLLRVEARNPADTQTFRTMKEFVYGTANNGTDLRNGKLVSATRHNYYDDVVPANDYLDPAEYVVKDDYKYTDTAGRKTERTTTITANGKIGLSPFTTQVQQFTTTESYDDLSLPKTVGYPSCIDCGQPPLDPGRTGMTRTYTAGRLTALSDFAASISYWPDGVRNILAHGNGINDTQNVTSMPRPSEIKFATYDRCVRPSFTTQPVGGTVAGGGGGFTLSVDVSGTAPFSYQWHDVTHTQELGTDRTMNVNPTSDTLYYVTVSNPCGYEDSQTAKVTASGCPLPTTGYIQAVSQPDGSWILKPNPTMRQGATFSWVRLSDNQPAGSTQTLAITALSSTTSYRLTITDACGSGSGDVTVTVPLPVTPGMSATWSAVTGTVGLTWTAISGATQYTIERRSAGGAWEVAGTSNTNAFTDSSGLVAARTYVYRVTSNNGGHTNYDVATTMTIPPPTVGTRITLQATSDMLAAVNKVREAAGWPAVTWSNILSANDPLPLAGAIISSRHILACRVRMNEALQALGVAVGPYTDADVRNLVIKASYINEVEQRAQ